MAAAAAAGLCGIDPLAYLNAQDPADQVVLDAVVETAVKHQRQLLEYHASMVARAVWGGTPKKHG